jgi:hypothetical protein
MSSFKRSLLFLIAAMTMPLLAHAQAFTCTTPGGVYYKACPLMGASCSHDILGYIPMESGVSALLGNVTCCGETFSNQLTGIGGQCFTAELRNPVTTKRIYELAMLDEVLAVNCHGYLENVRSNIAILQPPVFKEEFTKSSHGTGR